MSSDHAAVVTDPRSGVRVAFALEGGSKVALALDGDLALYAGAGPEGADVLHRARPNGTEDLVAFEARPASESLTYAVDVRAVAGLRLVARTLEMLDAKGSPRLRVAPPYVIDARGVRRDASISVAGCAFSKDPRAPWGRPVVSPGAASCAVTVRWDGDGLAYPLLVDPVWESADDFIEARTQAAYAELTPAAPASQVLFTGGFASGQVGATALKSAEIYFPLERAFAKTADMTGKRGAHTATLLANGTVLALNANRREAIVGTLMGQPCPAQHFPAGADLRHARRLAKPRRRQRQRHARNVRRQTGGGQQIGMGLIGAVLHRSNSRPSRR